MAEDGTKLKFRQSKGNNCAITEDTPINFTRIISPWLKFYELPSIGSLNMDNDGKSDRQTDGMMDGMMDGMTDG